jgi:hypothetical protein
VQDFRNLKVWERAHALTLEVYKASNAFLPDEISGMTIAVGSASELEYHLVLAHDLELIKASYYQRISEEVVEVKKGLVIVESPAKAKTIQKYLGSGYDVEASLGHIKDLPKKSLGVDLDNDFSTEYVVIPGKEKVVAKLKKLAKTANAIYLAPDPDREGEAIAAHLAEELGGDNVDGKKTKKKSASSPSAA